MKKCLLTAGAINKLGTVNNFDVDIKLSGMWEAQGKSFPMKGTTMLDGSVCMQQIEWKQRLKLRHLYLQVSFFDALKLRAKSQKEDKECLTKRRLP